MGGGASTLMSTFQQAKPGEVATSFNELVPGLSSEQRIEISQAWSNALAGVGDSFSTEDRDFSDKVGPFLEKVDLFKHISNEHRPKLVRACQPASFDVGVKMITQGDSGSEFFIIMSGTAKVEIDGKQAATLKSGDWFGEIALLRDEPRNATISADTKIECIKITRETFMQLGLDQALVYKNRRAVLGGNPEKANVKDASAKNADDKKLIADALRKNQNLTTMVTLDENMMNKMIDLMWKESVEEGKTVIKEGDHDADYFYVVSTGTFDILPFDIHLGPGDSFGELALLYSAPRAATVTATCEASVFVIARKQFKDIITKAQIESMNAHVKHLDKCPILDSLKDSEKQKVAAQMRDFEFSKGEHIFEQGDKGNLFFILIAGEVDVIKDGKSEKKLAASAEVAQFFGEAALLSNEPRAASIIVTSDMAHTLAMDKRSFDMLLGPLEELKKRGKDGTGVVEKTKKPEADKSRFGKVKRNQLKVIGLLGCGGFGAVSMVQHTETEKVYALKQLSKGYIQKVGMEESVVSEKDIQLMCNSNFIVKLFETYNSDQSLYFLLELALGGELYATYNRKALWGDEKCARFYVAGTVFAFEHLHESKIIFRDLKPENLLLNEQGQVKLTDMGLAKVCAGKTFTTCGTPDYFAPEIIASKGHGEAVDWWTLGILNFELLAGQPPFQSDSPMKTYKKITKGINKATFPKICKGQVESLIKGNCNADPSKRLPMKKGGTDNVKKADWYKGFDWANMADFTMDPPYKPVIKDKKDMRNFNASKEDLPPQLQYRDPGTGWDSEFATST